MEPTLFTRIINGEIPSKKLYEDETVYVFLDINPVQKWHTLIITKTPYRRMEDVDDEALAHAFLITKKMMKHMKKVLWCDYVHVVIEWVEVPHFHIKLIPSKIGVHNAEWHQSTYEEGEMDEYQEKLQMSI